uniref:SH3 domain-containing protein n=1 Tax=Mycena chlorophos TaxID=658473 RepID=A0ABQ0MCM3_MYCCL|nr:predicted protein [Mycena chlorophos]
MALKTVHDLVLDDDTDSLLEIDSDADELEEFVESSSSSLSLPLNETIDFDLVYALHAFPADLEGQANVAKGDSLFLLDDSNSYWWLVRVLKTEQVGYIPAENIETPLERLARLNKHRNVDLSSATTDEVRADLESTAAGLAPHPGNGVRNPLSRRQSLAFSCSLRVHRYPPAVWQEEEWLVAREEYRAATVPEYDEYDLSAFDEDEDHEEGDWEEGTFDAEDAQLAAETVDMMTLLTQTMSPPPSIPSRPSASASVDEVKVISAEASRPDTKLSKLVVEEERKPIEVSEREELDTPTTPTKVPEVLSPLPQAPPAQSPQSSSEGKLRKRGPPNGGDEREAKKKKGSGVFAIFSRKNGRDKSKNSSSSESENASRSSEDSSIRRSLSISSASTEGPNANVASPRQPSSLATETTVIQPRPAPQAISPVRSSSLAADVTDALSPRGSFISSPATPRSRPTSLILVPGAVDIITGKAPELSVIRVFAGPNLHTEVTFKTVLLNSTTTTEEMIKQAAHRFRLELLDPGDYCITVKRVEGTATVLQPDDRPLQVFEGLAEGAPRVTRRSSIGSIASLTSVLSNDFTDDSAVKFYLSRKTDNAVGTIAEAPLSSDVRFALQLVLHAVDLPDDMIFDPVTEAIIFKDALKDRVRISAGVSQTMRTKAFVLPMNVTVAEVIETGLERYGIEDGLVDGGDEVEDKVSRRKSVRLRYRLTMADARTGEERELLPSSRIVDALSKPPTAANKKNSEDESTPSFILRRATSYRTSYASSRPRSISSALDELALAKLHRNSISSVTSSSPPESTAGMTRQEIIAAQRKATRATQQAILSSTEDVRLSATSEKNIVASLDKPSETNSPRPSSRPLTPNSVGSTPLSDENFLRAATGTPTSGKPFSLASVFSRRQPSASSVFSDTVSGYVTAPSAPESPSRTPTPKASSQKKVFLPNDDFGMSHMMAIIELRAAQARPRPVVVPIHAVDAMLFGRKPEMNSLHPRMREIYAEGFKLLEQTDVYLDEFMSSKRKQA